MKVRCAAVQFTPVMGQKEENLRKLASLVVQAASQGAELIVLPELAANGYSFMGETQARAEAEIIAPDSRTVGLWMTLAAQLGVHIVAGMAELDFGTGDLYNSQVYVDPTGYFTSYRKVNRWGNDFLWAKPGRGNPPVVKAKFRNTTRKVGLLICRDVRDKKDDKWSSFYERGDADIVAFSSNWGDGGFPSVSWMEFVEDNGTALVVANRYGREGANNFGEGGICVIEPRGKVHCDGLVWSADCIVLADV